MYLQYYFETALHYLGHVFDIVSHRPIANLTVQVVDKSEYYLEIVAKCILCCDH